MCLINYHSCHHHVTILMSLPPFPIPRHLAFLRWQYQDQPESNRYGTAVLLAAMEREGMDTLPFRKAIQALVHMRVTWMDRFKNAYLLNEPDTLKIRTNFEDAKELIEKMLLGPMHTTKTWEKLQPTLLRLVRSDNPVRVIFRRIFAKIRTNADYIANIDNSGGFLALIELIFGSTETGEMFDHLLERENEWNIQKLYMLKVIIKQHVPVHWEQRFPAETGYLTFLWNQLPRKVSKDTLLYRGFTKKSGPISKRPDAWFAMCPMVASIYMVPGEWKDGNTVSKYCSDMGSISVFRATNEFTLIDLSNVKNVKHVRNIMIQTKTAENIINAFDRSWKIAPDGKIARKSILHLDIIWANWLCENGFQGYIAGPTSIHAEIFACNWRDYIGYLGTYKREEVLQVDFCNQIYVDADCMLHYG